MGLFTGIKCIGGRREFPFAEEGDDETTVYLLDCICHPGEYQPGEYDDTMTNAASAGVDVLPTGFADANAFWVRDSQPAFRGTDGLVAFTREFAQVPQTRIEPNGFYPFEFPRVPGGIRLEKTGTAKSNSYNSTTFILTLTVTLSSADAELFQDGEFLTIVNPGNWQYKLGSITFSTVIFSGFIQKSGNVFTLQTPFFGILNGVKTAVEWLGEVTSVNYQLRKQVSAARTVVETINAPSIIRRRYVKTSDPSSLELEKRFELHSPLNAKLTATTTSSLPFTTAEYQAAALNNQFINAENESLDRWRGNIYEISLPRVRML